MTDRTYPYRAWKLRPSFKPVEVEVVKKAYPHSSSWPDWDVEAGGAYVDSRNLYGSKEEAIAKGHLLLDEQEKALLKRRESIDKKRAALQKAANKA